MLKPVCPTNYATTNDMSQMKWVGTVLSLDRPLELQPPFWGRILGPCSGTPVKEQGFAFRSICVASPRVLLLPGPIPGPAGIINEYKMNTLRRPHIRRAMAKGNRTCNPQAVAQNSAWNPLAWKVYRLTQSVPPSDRKNWIMCRLNVLLHGATLTVWLHKEPRRPEDECPPVPKDMGHTYTHTNTHPDPQQAITINTSQSHTYAHTIQRRIWHLIIDGR